jgi:hypothetical protein
MIGMAAFRAWRPARRALTSILPEVPEPVGRKLCVANGVLDVFVPKIMLEGARVVAVIGEFEAAGMAQHVRVHAKRHFRNLPKPRDHSVEPSRAHRCSTLAQEYVPARLLLALKAAQGTQFCPGQRVNGGDAILGPGDVQPSMDEIDLLPAQGAQLGGSQSMSEGQKDHGRIPMAMPVVAGRFHQPLNFSLGKIFADAIMAVRKPAIGNCSLNSVWREGAR